MTHFEMNPYALWNEPRALFSKLKKQKKYLCFKKHTKNCISHQSENNLLVYGQKLIFNLGIPLNGNISVPGYQIFGKGHIEMSFKSIF